MEALHAMIEKTTQSRLINGFQVDTLILCDAKIKKVLNLKAILRWFEFISGLKINYDRCELIGIRTDTTFTFASASAFGCKVRNLPPKYLGLLLCMGLPKKKLWDTVVEHLDKKLSSWKRKYLSLGGTVAH